ncbi:MAG: uroporphyrinogen decarboxylase family protein [Prolixibacteraceae bacterium]|nr:uroporphyrinogen decarboxylase family protein [Prolixibacteraceae bacterium]
MDKSETTSMQRVLTALSHSEPDRVPLFLLLTMHGAKELGMSIKEYFSKADNVVEGQIRLQKKYKNDCFYTFFYAPIEIEAFGGSVIFSNDGPPNSGMPFISDVEQIMQLEAPKISKSAMLQRVLDATKKLNTVSAGSIPIIGVVMSPFSLPVMQMGFEKYLDIMHFRKDLFDHLMKINEEFCVNWANAQLDAGATAICYFDPVSSPTIIQREKYIETGFKIAKNTISKINGPVATHFASGRCLQIADLLPQTGTAVIGASSMEELSDLKTAFQNKLTILGNLNGIEMCRWTLDEARDEVRSAIQRAAPGGGFILADNHGEIPYQVSDDVLHAISNAVHKFGKYPLE